MINQLKAKEGMVVNLENGASKTFSLSKNANKKRKINKSKNSKLYKINDQSKQLKNPIRISVKNKLSDLRRHDFNYQKINQLQRCSNCILPITTPNINFDQQGVCNYCREHQPIKYRGAAALRKIVAKYRSKDGLPDCLIGFSGGRDSSYGLHFLKKELGLNPIAFTYDWGMVSDLGRRNQARMVGKLGVEHMLVAADIERNRGHIRQNILAWMNKPDLGMVPLFMQGDKVAEYYINRAAKRLGIKLVIFCRGNEFEKEEFKAGYAGVKDADPGGVIHDYSLPDKLRLLSYYGKQFLQNPAYLNGSLLNSLAGYWVTYMQQHDYLYLWHYLPWDEQQIIDTLRSEYDWETAEDTTSTWRIDDGSPAFYNYIYYQLQGFTEHDSFRSRQIREGVLSREEALNLVGEENQPRYEMLRWYFDVVGLDGHQVLQAVDQAPRRY